MTFFILLVKTCHDCQYNAALLPQPQRELQPILHPQNPKHHCGIDLICNMTPDYFGFQHILVIVCYLSKFLAANPPKTRTSREALNRLQDVYLTFGVPKVIQSDRQSIIEQGINLYFCTPADTYAYSEFNS